MLYAAGPLAFLGTAIHAHTHHRPLGAVTYAMLSMGVLLICLAVAARTRSTLNSNDLGKRRFGQVLLYGGALVSLALGWRGFLSILSSARSHPAYLASILDGLMGLSVSLVGGFLRYSPKLEHIAKIAGPLAIAVCVLAVLVALKYPNTSAALARSLALWALLKPG
jgi:hypothetical protein